MTRRVWVAIAAAAALTWALGPAAGRAQDGPPPEIVVDPSVLDFGDQVAGRASERRRVTITNGGGGQLYVNSVVLDGENSDDFAIASDGCSGKTLAPGKSCVVDVVLTPSAPERRVARLTVNGNAGVTSQTVELTGNGINSVDVPPDGTAAR